MCIRDSCPIAAHMADEISALPLFRKIAVRVRGGMRAVPVCVVCHGDGAVRALNGTTARPAGDEFVVPAPVQKENRLVASRLVREKPLRQNRADRIGRRFSAHIADGDRWQTRVSVSFGQGNECVNTALRLVIRQKRGGRGRKQHHGAVVTAAVPGDIVGGVFRVCFRFVGVFVFLVDEDHAEMGNRCEHGRACADDDVRFAFSDPPPRVQPFTA